jgi:DNA repair exonuclease SbcCD ATPase subunit
VNIKNQVKTIKEEIKNKQLLQKSHLSGISENMKDRAEDYENYKRSLYYQLKNECSGTIKTDTPLKALINSHPEMQAYDEKLTYYNNHIQDLQNTLKNDTANYKKRMIQLRELLKTDLNDLEKRVVKMTMKEEKRTVRKLIREKTKETTSAVSNIQKIMKATQKNREKKYKKINKTIKKLKKLQLKENKEVERAEKKLRKTLRKTGEYTEEFTDQSVRDLKNTYSGIIDAELAQLDNRITGQELAKVEAKRAKQREKEELRANKKAEKEHARATKKALKEVEKLAKKQDRATKKAKPV